MLAHADFICTLNVEITLIFSLDFLKKLATSLSCGTLTTFENRTTGRYRPVAKLSVLQPTSIDSTNKFNIFNNSNKIKIVLHVPMFFLLYSYLIMSIWIGYFVN